jgi:hypothetical protein
MDYYNLATPIEKDGKTYWTRCGVMFETKSGKGFNIILNSFPVNGRLVANKNIPKNYYRTSHGGDEDYERGYGRPQGEYGNDDQPINEEDIPF